jgi:hypothetical protein
MTTSIELQPVFATDPAAVRQPSPQQPSAEQPCAQEVSMRQSPTPPPILQSRTPQSPAPQSPAPQAAIQWISTPEAERDVDNLYATVPLPQGPLSKCIRVLNVEATQADHNSPIIARLDVIDLASSPKPSFTALSYVWGEELERHTILCNGIRLGVTWNCMSALRHLRDTLGRFTIWVDAICINQRDNDYEKKQQLPLMGEIYSGAEVTYVWLGESTEKSDRAVPYLKGLGLVGCYFRAKVWVAVWFLQTSFRCSEHDRLPCSGTSFLCSLMLNYMEFSLIIFLVQRQNLHITQRSMGSTHTPYIAT